MKFWTSENGPPPARKTKKITSELDKHEEYLKLRAMVLGGRMRPNEMAGIYMGPDDVKQIGYKYPWRTAADQLRRLIRSMNLQADYSVMKYETSNGTWFVAVKYNPPMVKTAQPREVAAQTEVRRAPGRPRKTA